jgi:hypothetical protein
MHTCIGLFSFLSSLRLRLPFTLKVSAHAIYLFFIFLFFIPSSLAYDPISHTTHPILLLYSKVNVIENEFPSLRALCIPFLLQILLLLYFLYYSSMHTMYNFFLKTFLLFAYSNIHVYAELNMNITIRKTYSFWL